MRIALVSTTAELSELLPTHTLLEPAKEPENSLRWVYKLVRGVLH